MELLIIIDIEGVAIILLIDDIIETILDIRLDLIFVLDSGGVDIEVMTELLIMLGMLLTLELRIVMLFILDLGVILFMLDLGVILFMLDLGVILFMLDLGVLELRVILGITVVDSGLHLREFRKFCTLFSTIRASKFSD